MKLKLILLATILLLTACSSTATATSQENAVATVVAGTYQTLTASAPTEQPTSLPTATSIPISLQTSSPTGEWTAWPPYIKKEQAQYLFHLEFDTNQWEINNDSTQNVYGLKRFEQYLSNQQIPECAIIQTIGSGLSSEYSVKDGQKNINGITFDTKSVKRNGKLVFVIYSTNLNLDSRYLNIFVVGGSDNCLASGEQVLSTLKAAPIDSITPKP
jgi:hypothetical protein